MKERMSLYKNILSSNKGSAIVIAMLTLLIVTIIGLSTIDNSITEKTIATNDILYKQAFSAADGGTQVAVKLIEKNVACSEGFFINTSPPLYFAGGLNGDGNVNKVSTSDSAVLAIEDSNFAIDGENPVAETNSSFPSDTKRDIYFVENNPDDEISLSDMGNSDSIPHTNIAVEEVTKFIAGTSLLMAEGYSGIGKGSGNRGVQLLYNIHSKNEYRARNSCSHIVIEYRHVVGEEENDCEYE
ncbi:MAG: PilX N-terminal domain-containing pilus assembly protein [Desulfamplus sp.]